MIEQWDGLDITVSRTEKKFKESVIEFCDTVNEKIFAHINKENLEQDYYQIAKTNLPGRYFVLIYASDKLQNYLIRYYFMVFNTSAEEIDLCWDQMYEMLDIICDASVDLLDDDFSFEHVWVNPEDYEWSEMVAEPIYDAGPYIPPDVGDTSSSNEISEVVDAEFSDKDTQPEKKDAEFTDKKEDSSE